MSKSINPKKQHHWNFKHANAQDIVKGILAKDVNMLSNAITLAESESQLDRDIIVTVLELLKADWISNDSIRIGITGPPGVGKSTFIERLGNFIIAREDNLAVLAIDPSSNDSKGSILGDKTRMETLSRSESAFIRPNPSRSHLGGMSPSTHSSILLCEVADFRHIILETVGVGQSEIEIKHLTDTVIVLLQPGSGDDLQGIKKGLMEIADILIVHKMDGSQLNMAKQKISQLKQLYPRKKVIGFSSLDEHQSLSTLYQAILDVSKGSENRLNQLAQLTTIELDHGILNHYKKTELYKTLIDVKAGNLPGSQSKLLLDKLKSMSII